MVFATILKYLPMGDNMKVAFGTSVVLAISYATLARKGTSYDNMAEKREADASSVVASELRRAAHHRNNLPHTAQHHRHTLTDPWAR